MSDNDNNSKTTTTTNWESVWDDILHQDGNPRWKVDDWHIKEQALQCIVQYHQQQQQQQQPPPPQKAGGSSLCLDHGANNDTPTVAVVAAAAPGPPSLQMFCPLAGDDPFVALAWQQGHSVTTIDLVGAAVAVQRRQINRMIGEGLQPNDDSSGWTETTVSSTLTKWTHSSGRATFYVGDALPPITGLLPGTFDAVYDKDAFGALAISMRAAYCDRLAEYLKPGSGIVYTEVKIKSDDHPDRTVGPPFHVEKEDLMASFGAHRFDYVASLGKVYDITMPPGMTQTGHILVRKK